MYAAYLKERENRDILETPYGFAIVQEMSDCLYLQDIYVLPEFRKQGKGREMLLIVEDAARSMGFKKVIGSCCPNTAGADTSLRVILACGFKLLSCSENIIYLVKELT
jgi:GNAT superfamily N-acetyltransferase